MPASVQTLRISAPLKEKGKWIQHLPPAERKYMQSIFKKFQLTCAIRTQSSQQLKSYVPFNTHWTSMYLEYVSSPLKKSG